MTIEVLCEGYHDRAFWAGMLQWVGYESMQPGQLHPTTQRTLPKGAYAFSANGSKCGLQVLPCQGTRGVTKTLRHRLRDSEVVGLLVVNLDPDGDGDRPSGLSLQDLQRIAGEEGLQARRDGDLLQIEGRELRLGLMRWESKDDLSPLQLSQNLERVILSVLWERQSERLQSVHAWLENEECRTGKGYTWSYMAKWRSGDGCEHFYRALWENRDLAASLERILSESPVNRAVLDCIREGLTGS